jgi:hypothetical protein
VPKESEQISVDLDIEEIAKALIPHLSKLQHKEVKEEVRRSKYDERLIFGLFIAVAILSVSCVLCALMSAISASAYSRAIGKLLR